MRAWSANTCIRDAPHVRAAARITRPPRGRRRSRRVRRVPLRTRRVARAGEPDRRGACRRQRSRRARPGARTRVCARPRARAPCRSSQPPPGSGTRPPPAPAAWRPQRRAGRASTPRASTPHVSTILSLTRPILPAVVTLRADEPARAHTPSPGSPRDRRLRRGRRRLGRRPPRQCARLPARGRAAGGVDRHRRRRQPVQVDREDPRPLPVLQPDRGPAQAAAGEQRRPQLRGRSQAAAR